MENKITVVGKSAEHCNQWTNHVVLDCQERRQVSAGHGFFNDASWFMHSTLKVISYHRIGSGAAVVATKNIITFLVMVDMSAPKCPVEQKPEFEEWDSVTQGVILGAFFYGYIFTQIPGGYLAHLHGGKLVYVVGVFGLFEGVTYPAMHVVWSHWAPFLEKTRLASFAFSGSYFGTVFAMPVSAMLGYRLGWFKVLIAVTTAFNFKEIKVDHMWKDQNLIETAFVYVLAGSREETALLFVVRHVHLLTAGRSFSASSQR
uniref:Major facilitator superfamily (MFS) profile domain-containing protein n=1 Tax=Parascaris equorum TaxID=6256 RepID=A0A914RQQ9_PAREQ